VLLCALYLSIGRTSIKIYEEILLVNGKDLCHYYYYFFFVRLENYRPVLLNIRQTKNEINSSIDQYEDLLVGQYVKCTRTAVVLRKDTLRPQAPSFSSVISLEPVSTREDVRNSAKLVKTWSYIS
jgi:hypothetical protein